MAEIRVLAVRQPWASLIVEGLKSIEVRSRPTNIRGRIAIYASRSLQSNTDFVAIQQNIAKLALDYPKKFSGYDSSAGYPVGQILGTVEITQSFRIFSYNDFEEYSRYHLAPDSYFDLINTYFWALDKEIKFENPIPYKPPKGAVVWSKTVLPDGYQ